jgi:predicted XRE-type DNA-binding protein
MPTVHVSVADAFVQSQEAFEPQSERVPRISRMLALAIHLKGIIERKELVNYAEIAELGYVSRPRVSQIMDLNFLAPDIQEEVLFLPEITKGRDPWQERRLRKISYELEWSRQREMWNEMVRDAKKAINICCEAN